VSPYRLVSDGRADSDVEAAFDWYEDEQPGLGLEFLDELRAAYDRIAEGPFKYRDLGTGIRRALTRRFPYAIYFSVEDEVAVILAVLRANRDPTEWQRRG
jgi:plasmid stabilization system protein ParE